jgi:hypothetical protein
VYKTPPASSRGWVTGPVYVFEKNTGTKSSTFVGRIIERARIATQSERGATVQVVRYGGKLWRLYPPEIFPELSRKRWIKDGDTLYGHDYAELVLPLEHPFMFDCDQSLGSY